MFKGVVPGYHPTGDTRAPPWVPTRVHTRGYPRVFALLKQTRLISCRSSCSSTELFGTEEIKPEKGSSPSSTLGNATAVDTRRWGGGSGGALRCGVLVIIVIRIY